MASRRFLVGWVIGLVVLGLLAAWLTLRPALLNKNQAFIGYLNILSIPNQSKSNKIPVQVGISIEKISDFSIKNVAWNSDFYVWFKWQQPPDDPTFDPGEAFQVVAGTIQNKQKVVDTINGNEHYALYRVSASINYPFDVSRYPLDDHLLTMFIQDPVHPQIQYIADTNNSRVDPAIHIPGYFITRTVMGVKTISENTTLGNPSGSKDSAQFGFGIFIYRQGFGFYLKLFQALFAAVGVALMAGFFKAHEEIRIELLVGGFFAAVANSYITSTYLPDTGIMTLLDQINLLGLTTIFICLVQTVISSRIAINGNQDFSKRFDQVSFGIIAFVYIALNIALPLSAQIH
jgi:hypothetical protein